ncbi:hypothetical protein [Kitasatospora sp. NPDC004289]
MEFHRAGRLRRRAAKVLAVAVAMLLADGFWVARSGLGDAGQYALAVVALLTAVFGVSRLVEAARPFRLRVDDHGIALHDHELSWSQITAVALEYPDAVEGYEGDDRSYPDPWLVLWPVPPVVLAGKPAGQRGGHPGYRVAGCTDLTPGVGELSAALVRWGGPRFVTAPAGIGAEPTAGLPAGYHGPEEWQEYVVTDDSHRRAAVARAVWVAGLLYGTAVGLGLAGVRSFDAFGRAPLLPFGLLAPYLVLAGLSRARRYRRWARRPQRLRIGSRGIGLRPRGGQEVLLDWAELTAVRIAPRPDLTDGAAWLTVWAVPGTRYGASGDFRQDGLWARALVPVAGLPARFLTPEQALLRYSGGRYRESG